VRAPSPPGPLSHLRGRGGARPKSTCPPIPSYHPSGSPRPRTRGRGAGGGGGGLAGGGAGGPHPRPPRGGGGPGGRPLLAPLDLRVTGALGPVAFGNLAGPPLVVLRPGGDGLLALLFLAGRGGDSGLARRGRGARLGGVGAAGVGAAGIVLVVVAVLLAGRRR